MIQKIIKITIAAVFIPILCALTASCSGETKDVPAEEAAAQIISECNVAEMIGINDGILEKRYIGISLESLEEYSVNLCSSGAFADEVAVFKLKDSADKEALLETINERKQELMAIFVDYVPEEIQKIESAVIRTYGNYVVFAVTPDNANAGAISDSLFK